ARCGVRIVGGRVIRRRLILTVQTGPRGLVTVSGKALRSGSRRLPSASTTKLVIPLSHAGLKALHRRHRRRIRVLVTFVATHESGSGTAADSPMPVVNPPSRAATSERSVGLLCGYFSCGKVPTEMP